MWRLLAYTPIMLSNLEFGGSCWCGCRFPGVRLPVPCQSECRLDALRSLSRANTSAYIRAASVCVCVCLCWRGRGTWADLSGLRSVLLIAFSPLPWVSQGAGSPRAAYSWVHSHEPLDIHSKYMVRRTMFGGRYAREQRLGPPQNLD